jgi:Putative Flp pilus-assembly TadE/G-like
MVNDRRRRTGNERGAVLVHAAIAMLALMAFNALAIDYGTLWLSRSQAQNAADSAALAGALSLAFDDPDDIPRAQNAAAAAGRANLVLGAPPSIVPATDVTLVGCPPGAPGLPDTCVRADVYRSAARANPLPTFFAQIMGITSQDIRATATAQVTTGNAVECMKPWAVADKWDENWEAGKPNPNPWTPDSNFDKYIKKGKEYIPDPSVTTPDVYIAPTATDPGTGFAPFDSRGHPTADYGLQLVLKLGDSHGTLSSGWFLALDLRNEDGSTGSGADDYRENIRNCNGTVYKIGDTLNVDSEQGKMVGPTNQGVEGGGPGGMGLTERDPGAVWNTSTRSIQGSCAPGVCADGKWYARSPRIVPVPLFDVDAFFAGSPTGKTTVTITNIMGFFIEGMCGKGNKDVCGRLVAIPGLKQGGGSVDETASFLRKVLLVR